MNAVSSWDFRDEQELAISQEYNNEGYIIEDANLVYLESIKTSIEKAFFSYFDVKGGVNPSLEEPTTVSSIMRVMTFAYTL